ncbi:MAG: hypothetical protein RLZZ450_1704 [Pseudomonadota bacterium]
MASSLTAEPERTFGFGDTSFLALVSPHVYSRSDTGERFYRNDLRDPTRTEMVTPYGSAARPAALQIHGDWAYRVSSSNSHEAFYLEIERWSLSQLGTKQTVADGFRPPFAYPIVDTANSNIVTGPGAASFAVTPTHMLVLANHYPIADSSPSSSVLYRLPLPPAL